MNSSQHSAPYAKRCRLSEKHVAAMPKLTIFRAFLDQLMLKKSWRSLCSLLARVLLMISPGNGYLWGAAPVVWPQLNFVVSITIWSLNRAGPQQAAAPRQLND